jgi:type IV pilus assembly protein PilW
MIAMTISSVLMIGAISVFAHSRDIYRTADNIARLQETLGFAASTLQSDLRLTEYWGRTNRRDTIIRSATLTIACARNDVTNWALDLSRAIEAIDDNYNLPCPGNDPRQASDVLVVRHARPGIRRPADKIVQIQSNGTGGKIFNNGARPADFETGGAVHDVVVSAYYVSNQSTFDSGQPALRRYTLVRGVMQDQEIIPGIENMQVTFGIDANGNNLVDRYVDGAHPDLGKPDHRILSVRLWLLARAEINEAGQGYRDRRTYRPPDNDRGTITPTDDNDYPPEYRRASLTQTIWLRNAPVATE